MRKWIIVSLVLLFPFTTLSAEAKQPEVYIAIGDSIATGQTPYRAIDTGYTDLIAGELTRSHQLAFYSKALTFPGFTTADVLSTVRSSEGRELLQNATLVTISAGANDLLRLVQANPSNGSLSFQQVPANFSLNNVRKNMAEILNEVKEIAPKAKIYVMGYYFAYPHARDSQKSGVSEELNTLNTILKMQAEANNAIYVSVEEAFGIQAKELVPNPTDVHPSMEGYRQMANAFFSKYDKRMQVSEKELPLPNPLTFEEILSGQKEAITSPVSRINGLDHYFSLTELKPLI